MVSPPGFLFPFLVLYLFFIIDTTITNWTTATTATTTTHHHHHHFNQPPSHSTRRNGDGSNRARDMAGCWFIFFFIINFCYTNVYFMLIYLRIYRLGINEDSRRDASRVLRYVFIIYIYIYNYTNEFLKVLCLRMEKSGAAGKGWG